MMTPGCPSGSSGLHGRHAAAYGCGAGNSLLYGRHVEINGCAVGSPELYKSQVVSRVRLGSQVCYKWICRLLVLGLGMPFVYKFFGQN